MLPIGVTLETGSTRQTGLRDMQGGLRKITTLVGAALVASLLAGCGGSAEGRQPTPTKTCPTAVPTPTAKVAPSTIYVNVVNASSKGGLAAQTSKYLGWRGFKVLEVSNQSVMDDRPAPKAAEIRHGKSGRQIALTLATQVQNPVLVEDDRTDPTVDLVLGDSFALVPVPPPPPSEVKVNVYNTTYRSGLSGEVAKQLKARGFTVLSNGNDPSKSFLPDDVALIRHGERGEPNARRVALQFKGARLVQDGREGTDVDVALGNKYAQLVPEAQATPPPTPKPSRPPGC